MKIIRRDSLRILQWNADVLNTKMDELKARAVDMNLDVILIQETKLKPHMKTPRIPGFKEAMRQDRIVIDGGGLLCYTKDTVIFEKLFMRVKSATEAASFRIRMDKTNWVHITNVYIPPAHSKGQEINFSPEVIPVVESSIIC